MESAREQQKGHHSVNSLLKKTDKLSRRDAEKRLMGMLQQLDDKSSSSLGLADEHNMATHAETLFVVE